MSDSANWQNGGCHCGQVRFRVLLHSNAALACDCSICAKKGFINIIVAAEDFQLIQGEDSLQTYRFNTGVAQHRFCRTCGIHPFTRPRSHPDGYDINARCLDNGLDGLDIVPFNGQHWEDSVHAIQHST